MEGENRALRGVRGDYAFSSAGSVSVALSTILLFAWIGRTLGADDLGLFSQIRRVSAMWVPIGSLGVSMALGRFIPRTDDLRLIRLRSFQTLLLVLAMLALHASLAALPGAPGALTPVIGTRVELLWPLILQLTALCVLILPYAILRGLHRIRTAASVQVLGYAAWPLIATALSEGESLQTLLTTIATGQLVFGGSVCGAVLLWVTPTTAPTLPEADPGLRTWLVYGLARLPGGLSQFILWAGIPMVLIHWGRTTEVALANAVTSLVNLPVLILSPLAFVLLPRLSLAQVQGEDQEVQAFLRKGLRIAWELQLPATFTLGLFLAPVLNTWLGFESRSFIETGRWMVGGIPALSLFMFLRPASDARSMVPYAVLAQGVGLLAGGLWLLVTVEQHRIVDLGRAFFIAQTAAAAALGFWCMNLHSMRPPLPIARLALQLLPLAAGGALVTQLRALWPRIGLWSCAVLAYGGALLLTSSPVVSPVARFFRRAR